MAFDTETPLLEHFFTEVENDEPVKITKRSVIDLQDDDKLFNEPFGEVITQESFDNTSIQHLLKRVSLAGDHLAMACEAYSEILYAEKDPFSHNPSLAIAKSQAVYTEIYKPYTPKNFALESVAYRSVIATESEKQKSLIRRIFDSIAKAISWILTKIAKLFGFSKDSKKSEKISKDTEKTKEKIEKINEAIGNIVKENRDIPEVQHAHPLTTVGDMLHRLNEVDKFRKKYAELNGSETPVLNAYRRLSYYVNDLDANRLVESIKSVSPIIVRIKEIERVIKTVVGRFEALVKDFKSIDTPNFQSNVEHYIDETQKSFLTVRRAFSAFEKEERGENLFPQNLTATTVDRDFVRAEFRAIKDFRYDDRAVFAISSFSTNIKDESEKDNLFTYDVYAACFVGGDRGLECSHPTNFKYNIDDLLKIKFADESGQKAILSAIEGVTALFETYEDGRAGLEESIKNLCTEFATMANDFKNSIEKFEKMDDRPIHISGGVINDPMMRVRPFSQICKIVTQSLNGLVDIAVDLREIPTDAVGRFQSARNWALYSAEANRLYLERLAAQNKES